MQKLESIEILLASEEIIISNLDNIKSPTKRNSN